ncbi:MAG: PP2C family protein-serine/threonine phosphatase [candidate division KSB1 bacterium]|nr:PP2C family protein-serine/threonine phosphatase [candidate division KSB1 bacterium]
MPPTETSFSLPGRLHTFVRALQNLHPLPKSLRGNLLGWSGTLVALALTTAMHIPAQDLLLLIYFIFLYRLSRQLWERFRPPYEVLMFLFYLFLMLDGFIIRFTSGGTPGAFLTFWHVIFLGLLGFVLTLQITTNGAGKRGQLFWFAFLLIIAENFIPDQRELLQFFFAALLFISVLQQTRWLQSLTRRECFLYLPLLLLFYNYLTGWPLPSLINMRHFADAELWATAPTYMFMVLQFQALAAAVKIPVVLVYNHARLSRKLWISGLFQSTFPQFMQFFVLSLLFYFLIAGWQANQLKWALIELPSAPPAAASDDGDSLVLHHLRGDTTITLPGYEPLLLLRPIPSEGILRLDPVLESDGNRTGAPAYFLFRSVPDTAGRSFQLLRLNRRFMKMLVAQRPPLIGSHLVSHSYDLPAWAAWLYRFNILTPQSGIHIFPFSLITPAPASPIAAPFPTIREEKDAPSVWPSTMGGALIIFGRVLAPMYNFELKSTGFYAFDIAFIPDASFFRSSIFRFALYLLGFYLLLNFFIIRRVAKLGAEINSMIVQKFNQLRQGVAQIARGNLDYRIHLEGQDEFVELADHFNRLGGELKKNIEEAREKERLQQELKIARDVQLSLLPKSLPEIPGFDIAATLQTANEVGGDFYDVLPIGRDRFLITLGDVSGKSTSAAFYMAQCISLLRFAPEFSTDLLEIVKRLNRYFTDARVDRQIFVTAIVGLLQTQRGELRLIRAGHTPPLRLQANGTGEVQEITSQGTGIGIIRQERVFEQSLQTVSIDLQPGETLVLYSDGLIEASRPALKAHAGGSQENVEFYTEERLKALLATLAHQPAQTILEEVLRDLHDFYAGHPLTDDVSLMVIQRVEQDKTSGTL